MIAVRLENTLIEAIDLFAQREHSNRSGVIRQAIVRFFEDHEDIRAAKSAKRRMKSTKPLLQLRRELELDH